MTCIELSFPAKRYHATAWGRHVNEGVPEWPPSPFRIARALVDIWYRRRPSWPEERIARALRLLAGEPRYELPAMSLGHIRAYMSQKTDAADDKKLIFDAFVALDSQSRVHIHLPTAGNGDDEDAALADLSELLAELDYLGRSQSWIDARVVDHVAPKSSEADMPKERVACLIAPDEYQKLAVPTIGRGKGKHAARWVEAISLSSKEIQSLGWSLSPALTWVDVPLVTENRSRAGRDHRQAGFVQATYRLDSRVLPLVTDTVSVAERCRRYLMGTHRRLQGGDPSRVSPTFSGKGRDGRPARGHQHAYFLPFDQDGDGRIDHLIVFAAGGFDSSELATLDRFRRIHGSKGLPEIHLALTSLSSPKHDAGEWMSSRWRSATPFIPPRHYRRGRGPLEKWIEDELKRECANHGLPEPKVRAWLTETSHAPPKRWFEFKRSRKGERPRSGYGFSISFGEPVKGPFAVGYGAHFGLGLFLPDR
jgi:CRISPR-associated protein Csb2